MQVLFLIHGSLHGQEKAALERDPTLGCQGCCADPDLDAKWTVNMCMFKATKKMDISHQQFFLFITVQFHSEPPRMIRGLQWGMACIETSLEFLEEVTP